jgi:hypothetical protein
VYKFPVALLYSPPAFTIPRRQAVCPVLTRIGKDSSLEIFGFDRSLTP